MPTLEEYQDRAANWLARTLRGMLVSPAGSGKTVIVAAALLIVLRKRVRTSKVRIGWIAATKEQCDQARAAVAMFPELAAGIELTVECPTGMPADLEFDCLLVDECHHGPAATWAFHINRHKGALWMMTATPDADDQERNAALLAMVGGNVFTIQRSEVAARVVPAAVVILDDTDLGLAPRIDEEITRKMSRLVPMMIRREWSDHWRAAFPDFCREHSIVIPNGPTGQDVRAKTAIISAGKWDAFNTHVETYIEQQAYRRCAFTTAHKLGVVPNKLRNEAVARVVDLHRAESSLVLVGTIEHGQKLRKLIEGAHLLYAKMGDKLRRETLAAFKAGEIKCAICTTLADEGMDCPIASVLVLAGAGRSKSRTEQRTGRVLRATPGKERGMIFDFSDALLHPLLARQAKQRQRTFRALGYRFTNPQTVLQPSCL